MSAFLSEILEVPDDLDEFNAYALEQQWSDGLPLIPPTEQRVARMLAGYDDAYDAVVARLPVENADAHGVFARLPHDSHIAYTRDATANIDQQQS